MKREAAERGVTGRLPGGGVIYPETQSRGFERVLGTLALGLSHWSCCAAPLGGGLLGAQASPSILPALPALAPQVPLMWAHAQAAGAGFSGQVQEAGVAPCREHLGTTSHRAPPCRSPRHTSIGTPWPGPGRKGFSGRCGDMLGLRAVVLHHIQASSLKPRLSGFPSVHHDDPRATHYFQCRS